MLPDYPNIKREISQVLTEYLQTRILQRSAHMDGIAKSIIHEGGKSTIVRASGETDEIDIKTASGEAPITEDELKTMDLGGIRQKLDAIAEEMASQQAEHFFDVLVDATNKTGNVVDGKGNPLTNELLLEVLEKMPIEFNEDGTHSDLRIVVGPDSEETIKKLMEEFDNDPVLKDQYDRLMKRKREEFNAREASRILVG